MELIQLKGVDRKFGKHHILEDVNVTLEEGDVLGVIGQSGSGKTTFLNLISGFLEPSDGEALYFPGPTSEPIDLNKNLHKIKKNIGYTSQHNSFYSKLTVKENLIHFGKMYGLKNDTLLTNIKSLLNFTKLSGHQNKLAEQLSGGMQKRLDISCSIAHKPKILILDEPTADLDPVLQDEMLHFLEEINKQGVTIVIASHNLEGLERIANKVAIIHKNRVYSHGLIEDIRKPYQMDGFKINLHSLSDKKKMLELLKKKSHQKIVDRGYSITVHSKDCNKSIQEVLNLIRSKHVHFDEIDLRKLSLNHVFEKILEE